MDKLYLKEQIENKIAYEFDSVIMNQLNIGKDLYYSIVTQYNIKKYTRSEKLFNNACRKISKNDLEDFYIKENHNLYQVRDHFKIGWDILMKLLDFYKIKKDWTQIIATRKSNNLLLNGSENYVNIKSRMSTIHNRTQAEKDAINQKRRNTCNKKFNADSNLSLPEVREQIKQTCLKKYGVSHYSQTKEWYEKAVSSYTDHYGIDWYSKTTDYQLKINETKRKNKSNTKSEAEELFYKELLKIFESSDIIRQYTDIRYSNPFNNHLFNCDFYIKSLDLFIELNITWLHGPHPFDNNDLNDLRLLEKIRSKQKYRINSKNKLVKNQYYTYEIIWTLKDNLKIKVAHTNNLKYITLYNYDELRTCLIMLKNLK